MFDNSVVHKSHNRFAFVSRNWDKYLICTIGDTRATINGHPVDLDVAPYIHNDRTMLTAKPIADTIGGTSYWDQVRQTARFYVPSGNYTVFMRVGSVTIDRTEPQVAPKRYTSDVPAMIRDGRTVLPLRVLGEAFGMATIYEADLNMVAVYSIDPHYRYNPKLDPESPEYCPIMDPDSEQYDKRHDPNSWDYDGEFVCRYCR